MFEYITAGESHGPALTTIIKDLPAGLNIDIDKINRELMRRQKGYGRGKRMDIEKDRVEISSGMRDGLTLGSPLTMTIKNKDWTNWKEVMSVRSKKYKAEKITKARPGHADLPGAIKYNFKDIRNILERASARETAARTAVGAVCRQFLGVFGIELRSHVIEIGSIKSPTWSKIKDDMEKDNYFKKVESSPLHCGDDKKTEEMIDLIDSWKEKGDSVGGVIELIGFGLPTGLGDHTHWDKKLDGKLAGALMSIQAIKGVEIGAGFQTAASPGSRVHDEIYYNEDKGFYRKTNKAGGLEGGMTNGQPLILKVAMKPIPTLAKPLHSVDIITKEEKTAAKERSDICAVPAASIVVEAVTASVLARSFTEKFSGDTIDEIKQSFSSYRKQVEKF